MEEEVPSDCINMDLNENNDCNEADRRMQEKEKVDEPKIGMLFNSNDELFDFYLCYSKKVGFAICKRSCRKDENGDVRYVTITCAREGKARRTSDKKINMHPISKTDCRARISATVCPDEKWKITSVVLDHNHGLSPNKSRFYRCNRVMQPHVKRRLELNDIAGIRMNKSFNSFVVEEGGHEKLMFQEKDCRNYIDKVRRLRLGEGDATAIHNYFLNMQADNSDFFYMIDLDDDGRVKNVFWADARSRAAFKEFGDVVTFDTTYLTNKYDMPFAPFVGVNHHGQSVLLGCGLISNEDVQTFTWLFKSWLVCMQGISPNAIITDQDKAMKKAIEIVFPDARHRWCLWHIMKKIPEKLGAHKDYKSIKFCLKSAVYNSLTTVEFEDSWWGLIARYNLKDNEWLHGLFDERRRWVPAFVKDTFWAGMSTTQKSESMNAFFDGYVNSKTSLKQFVEQYGNALRSKVEKESEEDFKSFNTRVPCITHYEMEKQFQKEYTTTKFKEFQDELIGKIRCTYSSTVECVGNLIQYEIGEDISIGETLRRANFKVCFNKDDNEVNCSCRLFQFKGILCKHVLMVLIDRKIYRIPDKYILKRWSKLEKRSHTKVKIAYNGWSLKPDSVRFEKMCKAFYEAAEMARDSDDRSNDVIECIDELKKKLSTDSRGRKCILMNSEVVPAKSDITCHTKESKPIQSPVAVRCKGRPPSNRSKSIIEKVVKKKRKKTKTDPPTQLPHAPTDEHVFGVCVTQESVKDCQTQGTCYLDHSNTSREFTYVNKDSQATGTPNFGQLHSIQGHEQFNMASHTQVIYDSGHPNFFGGCRLSNLDSYTQGTTAFFNSKGFQGHDESYTDSRMIETREFGQQNVLQDVRQPNMVPGDAYMQQEFNMSNQWHPQIKRF